VFFGTLTVTDALPDAQSLVEGRLCRVLADEKRHVVALSTTARRRTLPPDGGSVEGVAVKRPALALLTYRRRFLPFVTTNSLWTTSGVSAARVLCA
jgi:hypothetical protein